MKRALAAAGCLLACLGATKPQKPPCDPTAIPPPTAPPAVCETSPAPAGADFAACIAKPETVAYLATLRESLIDAIQCPPIQAPRVRAEVRFRIGPDGAIEEPCAVGAPAPLAATILAAVRKVRGGPAPTGALACLVGAPIDLYLTIARD